MHQGRRLPKQSKSLAAICQEVLGISLSKVCGMGVHMMFILIVSLDGGNGRKRKME